MQPAAVDDLIMMDSVEMLKIKDLERKVENLAKEVNRLQNLVEKSTRITTKLKLSQPTNFNQPISNNGFPELLQSGCLIPKLIKEKLVKN